jgi:hypothetical protein
VLSVVNFDSWEIIRIFLRFFMPIRLEGFLLWGKDGFMDGRDCLGFTLIVICGFFICGEGGIVD